MTAPSTASGPTVRSAWRTARGPALVVAALVLVGIGTAALTATGPGGRLDPAAASPAGSRALAQVLQAGGVAVTRAGTVDEVTAAAGADSTVVVPFPQALVESELRALSELGSGLLVVGADQASLDALELPVSAGADVRVDRRQAACPLPAAERAGEVDLGGTTYAPDGDVEAVGCYASGGRATLLVLPEERVALLGDGTPLTNDRLDDRGNAALSLGLLATGGDLVWFVPQAGRDLPADEQPALLDLVPRELRLGALWLLVVVGVLALWRGRRLGRVVEEPLPVVVRAAEAVEGRGRLYRAAGARGPAAQALRAATRDRAVRRAALPSTAERGQVVEVLAERTGSDPARIDALLYGGPPADDAALVRLADDLRILESTLNREVAGP